MTNENNQGLGFDCYDPNALAAPTKFANHILNKIPGADAPLICKLVPDVLDPKLATSGRLSPYYAFTEHTHIIGVNNRTGEPLYRGHTCQKTMGNKHCAECDAYYEIMDKLKLAGEGTPEGKKLKALTKLFKPAEKAWVYFVTPEGNTVKSLRLPKDLINKLWGKPKTKYRDAVPSLIDAMRQDGMNPFDLNSKTGWIKIYKTGEGFGTNYFVEVATREEVEMENGRAIGKRTRYVEAEVSEFIRKSYPRSDLTDCRKIQAASAFTPEESVAFAQTAVTPDRILEAANQDKESVSDADEANQKQPSVDAGLGSLGMTAGPSTPTPPKNDEADKYL
jgi:hypothetical protein